MVSFRLRLYPSEAYETERRAPLIPSADRKPLRSTLAISPDLLAGSIRHRTRSGWSAGMRAAGAERNALPAAA